MARPSSSPVDASPVSKSKKPEDAAAVLKIAEAKQKRDKLEDTFIEQMDAKRIMRTAWVREHKFALDLKSERYPRGRMWRFDFAFLALKIAVEVDGGTAVGGRHTTVKGFRSDCQKMNAAVGLGWKVLRGDSTMVKSHELVDSLEHLLRKELR